MNLEIYLFGGLRVLVNGEAVTTFMSAKAPAILAYLAVTGRVQRRDDLAALLWGEMPEADAKNNLRQVLTNLRRFVDPFLTITRETVEMNTATAFCLDVATFDKLLAAAPDLSPEARVAQWQAATALYAGDFLSGFFVRDAPAFEEWMLAQRVHYRERAIYLLHTLTQIHLDLGCYEQAIYSATRLLALDEWREEAHCQLMLALARSGQRSAALAQYKRCRQLLQAELGVEPAAETTALYERIRAAISAPRHNLPAALTRFVGRTDEIGELRRLLANPNTRLLTILGPGGIGKSRLALEVAAACEAIYLNGVWFISLSATQNSDADGLALALADALGCPLAGSGNPKAHLIAFLRQRELLLVLDNMETVTDGVAWLSELLHQAPGVTILATSRIRLNLQAEQLYLLDGLPVPAVTAADIDLFAAVELFIQCARRVQPDFTIEATEVAAVVRICQAVQGLPLGIELGAAWVHGLSCADIAAEIESSLDFLATTRHDVPPRQRTLRALFDWSWSRLRPEEQVVFRRLAAFYGPFTREAAAQVAGASLPLLAALGDKSLLWRRGATYQLHEVARHFAGEKLEQAGDAGVTRARHAAYYATFLAEREPRIKSREQKQVLTEIEREVDNVRAAWQWLVTVRETPQIAAAAGAFYHFHLLKSWFREGLTTFHSARLALEGITLPDRATQLAHSRLMAREARFHSSLSQYDEAQRLLAASRATLEQFNAPDELAFVLGHIGGTARMQGDLAAAEEHLQACLALRRQFNDQWGLAVTLLDLAGVAHLREQYTLARHYCEEGLAAGEQAGDLQISAHLLTGLSITQRQLGEHAQAEQLGRRSLAIYEELGDQYGIMQGTLTLGELNRQLGNHGAAQQFFQRAVQVAQEIGDRSGEADGYYGLGQIAAGEGKRGEAMEHLQSALYQAHAIQEMLMVLDILLELAALLADEDTVRARRILSGLLHQPQLPDQRRTRAAALLATLPVDGQADACAPKTLQEMLALATEYPYGSSQLNLRRHFGVHQ